MNNKLYATLYDHLIIRPFPKGNKDAQAFARVMKEMQAAINIQVDFVLTHSISTQSNILDDYTDSSIATVKTLMLEVT